MRLAARRRGEPLVALGGVLACWVAARAAILALPVDQPASIGPQAVLQPAKQAASPMFAANGAPTAKLAWAASNGLAVSSQPIARTVLAPTVVAPVPPRPAVVVPLPPTPSATDRDAEARTPSPGQSYRIVAGHQLLYVAAFASLPLPSELGQFAALRSDRAVARRTPPRWSADGWLLWRPDYLGSDSPGGPLPIYGASQAGFVVRYQLAPGAARLPQAYLRATSALDGARDQDLAVGISVRPIARLPLRAAAELRATRGSRRTVIRPAAFVVTELQPLELPGRIRAEAYGQAGVIGGSRATAFVDGQLRIDRRLFAAGRTELRAGIGGWGGAQQGAGRIDIGPGLTLGVPLGPGGARLSADWRFRVAGRAAPTSGPAITLSAGF